MENEVPPRTEITMIGGTGLESLLEGAQIIRVETPHGLLSLISIGDVTGMTYVPEATLARELEKRYTTLGFDSNMAEGMSEIPTFREVVEPSKSVSPKIRRILVGAIPYLPNTRHRSCGSPIEEARMGETKKC